MSPAICTFYTCVCMHVHACGDTPHAPDAPRQPLPTCTLPRAAGSPADNLILFEDSLPLNIPELI